MIEYDHCKLIEVMMMNIIARAMSASRAAIARLLNNQLVYLSGSPFLSWLKNYEIVYREHSFCIYNKRYEPFQLVYSSAWYRLLQNILIHVFVLLMLLSPSPFNVKLAALSLPMVVGYIYLAAERFFPNLNLFSLGFFFRLMLTVSGYYLISLLVFPILVQSALFFGTSALVHSKFLLLVTTHAAALVYYTARYLIDVDLIRDGGALLPCLLATCIIGAVVAALIGVTISLSGYASLGFVIESAILISLFAALFSYFYMTHWQSRSAELSLFRANMDQGIVHDSKENALNALRHYADRLGNGRVRRDIGSCDLPYLRLLANYFDDLLVNHFHDLYELVVNITRPARLRNLLNSSQADGTAPSLYDFLSVCDQFNRKDPFFFDICAKNFLILPVIFRLEHPYFNVVLSRCRGKKGTGLRLTSQERAILLSAIVTQGEAISDDLRVDVLERFGDVVVDERDAVQPNSVRQKFLSIVSFCKNILPSRCRRLIYNLGSSILVAGSYIGFESSCFNFPGHLASLGERGILTIFIARCLVDKIKIDKQLLSRFRLLDLDLVVSPRVMLSCLYIAAESGRIRELDINELVDMMSKVSRSLLTELVDRTTSCPLTHMPNKLYFKMSLSVLVAVSNHIDVLGRRNDRTYQLYQKAVETFFSYFISYLLRITYPNGQRSSVPAYSHELLCVLRVVGKSREHSVHTQLLRFAEGGLSRSVYWCTPKDTLERVFEAMSTTFWTDYHRERWRRCKTFACNYASKNKANSPTVRSHDPSQKTNNEILYFFKCLAADCAKAGPVRFHQADFNDGKAPQQYKLAYHKLLLWYAVDKVQQRNPGYVITSEDTDRHCQLMDHWKAFQSRFEHSCA